MNWLASAKPARQGRDNAMLARMASLIKARYDAAQTTPENQRHWGMADGLSSDAANSAGVRRIIRNRARYEVGNNPTLAGIVRTLVNDTIGTGPALQVKLPGNRAVAQFLEREFGAWAKRVNLTQKLWTARKARAVDGEAFAIMRTNPKLRSPVKLDLSLLECDRIADPGTLGVDPLYIDGVRLDEYDNPVSYTILRDHPGASVAFAVTQYADVPAEYVLHWYSHERPEQHRGVCEFVASLSLGAHLRRYSTATLSAAELIALISVFIETDATAAAESNLPPFDTLQLERMLLSTVPKGSAPQQAKPEQPSATFRDFHSANVGMMGRPMCMTYSVAAGDFSRTSFSASRMEDRNYGSSIDIDRVMVEEPILTRIFEAWIAEAREIPGYLPLGVDALELIPHSWSWDSRPHVDPVKVASAANMALKGGFATLAQVYMEQSGEDWFDAIQQLAVEVQTCNSLGIAHPYQIQPGAGDSDPTDPNNDETQPDNEGATDADSAE